MKDEDFNELLKSVQQADDIMQGKEAPSRVTEFSATEPRKTQNGIRDGSEPQESHTRNR